MAQSAFPSLKTLDLSARVEDEAAYKEELRELQLQVLREQVRQRDEPRFPVIIVFEGVDAAGKGGVIRRLTGRLDPRGYRVIPVGPPDPAERLHHWLWRFQARMPRKGEIVIWDRSWYGRVLVERVEELCSKEEWQRAYGEIAAFERSYSDAGAVIAKFWLQISKDEQLRRFREREQDPFKEYKIGPEDWRNREKWDDYMIAAEDMFRRTDQPAAPWTVVSAEDKRYARLRVLGTVVRSLQAAWQDD